MCRRLFQTLSSSIINHQSRSTKFLFSLGNSKPFSDSERTQMNSMFSSFDALCGELLGHAVGSNFAPAARSTRPSVPSDGHAADSASKSREAKKQPPPKPKPKESGRRSAPGFAPELDGLNSFETLVSY